MKLFRSGTLAFATTLAVLVPSAAVADSYVRPDSAKDVVKFDNQADDSATLVPDRTEGDILSSGVVHGKRRVKMAIRYSELTQTGDGSVHIFRIGTKHKIRDLLIVARPGHWAGIGYFLKDSNGKDASCPGIGWSINYATNLIQASVPRKCLGKPKWVHVGMGEESREDPAFFDDDALTNGYVGTNPRWGPRVHR